MQDYIANDISGLGLRERPRDNRKNPNRFEADHVAHRQSSTDGGETTVFNSHLQP